jgi:hypothetical protein
MNSTTSSKLGLVALAAAAWTAGAGLALAQPDAAHEIPQSQFVEHQDNLDHLKTLAGHPGEVGAVARRAVALFQRHEAREAEYIMPPLTLLPYLADGQVTPDMRWALIMTDRVRADRELIFNEHNEMIEVLNELQLAGRQAHDDEAVDFARSAATDALNDVEILEPTVMLIGDVLRARLGETH